MFNRPTYQMSDSMMGLWSYWLWIPVVLVCNFSHESLHFFAKNFISSLRITLGIFPLLLHLFHENIPCAGHMYLWVVRKMSFYLSV